MAGWLGQRRAGVLWWGMVALGAALLAIAAYVRVAGPGLAAAAPAALTGAALVSPPQPAPPFTLTDQFGASGGLAAGAGKPTALAFVYTRCPDVCPLIATNMHRARTLLGDAGRDVALVAVTVDPEGDDVAQARAFSDAVGLTDEWSFLTGPRPALEAVWRAYGITANVATPDPARLAHPAATQASQIEHAAPVFLIDKHGLLRALLPTTFTAETLAANLRVLAAER